jgi:hypothetical protein
MKLCHFSILFVLVKKYLPKNQRAIVLSVQVDSLLFSLEIEFLAKIYFKKIFDFKLV